MDQLGYVVVWKCCNCKYRICNNFVQSAVWHNHKLLTVNILFSLYSDSLAVVLLMAFTVRGWYKEVPLPCQGISFVASDVNVFKFVGSNFGRKLACVAFESLQYIFFPRPWHFGATLTKSFAAMQCGPPSLSMKAWHCGSSMNWGWISQLWEIQSVRLHSELL